MQNMSDFENLTVGKLCISKKLDSDKKACIHVAVIIAIISAACGVTSSTCTVLDFN